MLNGLQPVRLLHSSDCRPAFRSIAEAFGAEFRRGILATTTANEPIPKFTVIMDQNLTLAEITRIPCDTPIPRSVACPVKLPDGLPVAEIAGGRPSLVSAGERCVRAQSHGFRLTLWLGTRDCEPGLVGSAASLVVSAGLFWCRW